MRVSRLVAVVVALAVLFPGLAFAQAASVDGNWKVAFQSDAGPSEGSMALKQEGTKVVGDLTSDQGTVPIQGTFENNKINMIISIDACGQSFTITFTGVLEKDVLKGELDFGGLGTATWTATRAK